MPSFSNFYKNGLPKWNAFKTNRNATGQAAPTPVVPVVTPTSGLVGVDIKTNVQKESIKVVKNGVMIAHFDLDKISTWEVHGNEIIVYSSDEVPVTLTFISADEANIGDQRLLLASNGGLIA